jgi:hypothetical protein
MMSKPPMDEEARTARLARLAAAARVARRGAVVAAILTAVAAALIVTMYARLRVSDPLNNKDLLALRERFTTGAHDAALVAQVRALDLSARSAFFDAQFKLGRGAVVLGGSAATACLLLLCALILEQRIVKPPPATASETLWPAQAAARRTVACGWALLVLAAILIGAIVKSGLTVAGR